MFEYTKLTLNTLLSKVPEILNHNYEEVNNVFNKFYSDIKKALIPKTLEVEGQLQIEGSLDVNNLIIKNQNNQIVVSELFDRVKELEDILNGKKNINIPDTSTNNDDPIYPIDDPSINTPDIPTDPTIPEDPNINYDYDNCVSVKTYISKLTAVYNLIDDYKTENNVETSSDRLLATYNRNIHYNDIYWNSIYGSVDPSVNILVNSTYPDFKEIDYVHVKDDIYVDIVHFWAALEGMMNITNKDLAGWAGDIVDFATYIPNDNPSHEFPGKGFEYEDICADFDAVYVYSIYTTMNTNIVNAFRNVYLNYLSNTKYMIDVQRITAFIDYKGSKNINELYTNSDSSFTLRILQMQRNVNEENLAIAKNELQNYIDNLIPDTTNNSGSNITIPDSPYYADLEDYIPQLENVYTLINNYKTQNNLETSSDLLLARYNRSIHYNQFDWNREYGTPENDIIQLVNTTYPSFQNIKYVHILDNSWVDIIHLWAAVEGMFSNIKDLAGWGGDLINFGLNISTNNQSAVFPGPGFRNQDIAADFDAISIYQYLLNSNGNIVNAFTNVYRLYKNNINVESELFRNRVNVFVTYKGSSNVEEIYNASDSKDKIEEFRRNMGVSDEDFATAKIKLQEYINNQINSR